MEFEIDHPQLVNIGKVGSSPLGFISIAERLPFDIKRVYWTYYAPHDVIRGHHAHKTLQQLIFALSGNIVFELENQQGRQYKFSLDSPDTGLYIPRLHWRTMKFSHSAVLLCLASQTYDDGDYIRSYEEFRAWK